MLDFLANGLLVYYAVTDVQTLITLGYVFGSVVQLPFWIVAGVQDWKSHEIDDWVCKVIMFLTALHAVLFAGWGQFFVTLVCAFFVFREKEIELIGQADFVMFAHWLTVYWTAHCSGCGMFVVASLIFLLCLVLYMAVYKDKNGKRWRRGMMVPVLPPYSVSVVVSTILQYKLGLYFFWEGF